MKTALIPIAGVLRKTMGGARITEGIRLYRSLLATGQVILLLDDWKARDQADDWLELQGCILHAFVASGEGCTRLDLANRLRREGYGIDLVVEPDPSAAQELIKAGFNTLLFMHSQFAQPEWRPDTPAGVTPWKAITDRVQADARAKAADARLKGDD